MKHAAELRRCLLACDVEAVRRLWAEIAPHLPQRPEESAEQTLRSLHIARTAMRSLPFTARAYSHAWLTERGLPSQLPDPMRPRAERMYPRIVDGVGIAEGTRNPLLKPVALLVQDEIVDTVEDCYANGDKAPEIVKPRM